MQRLRELGWIEGRNVAIEYRWAEGQYERYAEIAAELVRLKVDVIVAAWNAAALAAKRRPRSSRSSSHWRRPGRRSASSRAWRDRAATSPAVDSAADLHGKRLELLREVDPRGSPVGSWPVDIPQAPLECARFGRRCKPLLAPRSAAHRRQRAATRAISTPAFASVLNDRADALYRHRRRVRQQPIGSASTRLAATHTIADDLRYRATTSKPAA